MDTDLKHSDITEKIIGASFEVHSFLGNGFQEVIYQRALAYEMTQKKLDFEREIDQHIFYKNLAEPIGTRRADFVVECKVLVELNHPALKVQGFSDGLKSYSRIKSESSSSPLLL